MSRIDNKLNLEWKFHRGDVPFPGYKGIDDSEWLDITLPHDWSVSEPFSKEHASGTGYLPGGVGWYRKSFDVKGPLEGKRVYINFDGVYNNSQVWCNTYYLGKRPYGYSAFGYDITPFVKSGDNQNVLSVKVDHKDIADSRWFTGAGIYREVMLTIVDELHISRHGVFVTTPEVSQNLAKIEVQVSIDNESNTAKNVKVVQFLRDYNGKEVAKVEGDLMVEAGGGYVKKQELKVEKPILWSPDSPYLYSLRTQLSVDGDLKDEVITSVGIRWFEFDANKGFFLNGESMKLKGLCIHHDAGCLGAAVPVEVWRRRLEKFKELGCNAIRMSHNPPASNLLDLCDEMGFLVQDEAFDEWEGVKNKWWQGHNVYPPKHYGYYEDFPEWHERDIKEMVMRDRNHPSIFSWSIGNEIDYPNDPYCHPSFQEMTGNNDKDKPEVERMYDPNKPNAERLGVIAKRLVKFVKECDESRPVTAALAFPELSNHTGYAEVLDVVGYNYKEQFYEADCAQYPNRVIFGSENGKHMEAWKAVRDYDNICGQFLWTGIDFLGEAKGWPVRISQAGLMDLTGRPKSSYYFRQSLWTEKPMVYLSTRDSSKIQVNQWDIDAHPVWNYDPDTLVKVYCYTNCEEVELFHNDISLGKKKLVDAEETFQIYEMIWDVDFEQGELKGIGLNDGIKVCEFALESVVSPCHIAARADMGQLDATGEAVAHIEVEAVDSQGNMVFDADDLVSVSIKGPGEIIGIENGDPADLTPYSECSRQLYHGKMLVYVRATTKEGIIHVSFESAHLGRVEISIMTQKKKQ